MTTKRTKLPPRRLTYEEQCRAQRTAVRYYLMALQQQVHEATHALLLDSPEVALAALLFKPSTKSTILRESATSNVKRLVIHLQRLVKVKTRGRRP